MSITPDLKEEPKNMKNIYNYNNNIKKKHALFKPLIIDFQIRISESFAHIFHSIISFCIQILLQKILKNVQFMRFQNILYENFCILKYNQSFFVYNYILDMQIEFFLLSSNAIKSLYIKPYLQRSLSYNKLKFCLKLSVYIINVTLTCYYDLSFFSLYNF